jgi:hypothetical protein
VADHRKTMGENTVEATPTAIVRVNERGNLVDDAGNHADVKLAPGVRGGAGDEGTLDMLYNPILEDHPVKLD